MGLNTDEEINNDIEPDAIKLCDWCRCEMTSGDCIVKSDATGDAEFCTESCLVEALIQDTDEPVKIISSAGPDADGTDDDDPLLECPHCHKTSRGTSDKWASEGPYTVIGENGYTFFIMICPNCGKGTPMKEPVPTEQEHRTIILIRPCCPLCRKPVGIFDHADEGIRYVCHTCKKIIAITELER